MQILQEVVKGHLIIRICLTSFVSPMLINISEVSFRKAFDMLKADYVFSTIAIFFYDEPLPSVVLSLPTNL